MIVDLFLLFNIYRPIFDMQLVSSVTTCYSHRLALLGWCVVLTNGTLCPPHEPLCGVLLPSYSSFQALWEYSFTEGFKIILCKDLPRAIQGYSGVPGIAATVNIAVDVTNVNTQQNCGENYDTGLFGWLLHNAAAISPNPVFDRNFFSFSPALSFYSVFLGTSSMQQRV